MRKQSYWEYIKSRIQFQLEAGFWIEYGEEGVFIIKNTKSEEVRVGSIKGDVNVNIMQCAKIARQSPQKIAEKLLPYAEDIKGISKVTTVNGYINFYLDRTALLMNELGF